MKILEQIVTGMNFSAKHEIINSILSSTADEILIVDPEREYTEVVKQLCNDKQMNKTKEAKKKRKKWIIKQKMKGNIYDS